MLNWVHFRRYWKTRKGHSSMCIIMNMNTRMIYLQKRFLLHPKQLQFNNKTFRDQLLISKQKFLPYRTQIHHLNLQALPDLHRHQRAIESLLQLYQDNLPNQIHLCPDVHPLQSHLYNGVPLHHLLLQLRNRRCVEQLHPRKLHGFKSLCKENLLHLPGLPGHRLLNQLHLPKDLRTHPPSSQCSHSFPR